MMCVCPARGTSSVGRLSQSDLGRGELNTVAGGSMRLTRCLMGVLAVVGLCLLLKTGKPAEVLAQAAPAGQKDKQKVEKKENGSKAPAAKGEPAQTKEAGKAATSGGVVEVYQAKDGWRFRIKNAQGKSLAIGVVGYATKEEALQVVQQVQGILNSQKVVTVEGKK